MKIKNEKIIIIASLLLLAGMAFVISSSDENFSAAEEIIKQKISCNNLTESQLEILGDYYMEQMHPGELHEIMDERMGGEGSESLRQVHINMGKIFYCGDNSGMYPGMMNMMMGRNMMYNNVGVNYYQNYQDNNLVSLNWIVPVLLIVIIILLIALIIKNKENKMVEETNLEGKIVYKCEKCGWLYRNIEIAEKCQNWCEKHKSCNLKYQKYAIKF